MEFKSEIHHLSGTQKELSVEVPAELVQREFDKAYTHLSRSAEVAGFRPGRAPRSVIKQRFSQQVREYVTGQLLPRLVTHVLDHHGLQLAADPQINHLSVQEGQPLRLSITVEVFPQFDVVNYKGMRLTKRVKAVSAADVDAELERLREEHAELVPVEGRPSQLGDFVTLRLRIRSMQPPADSPEQLDEQVLEIQLGAADVLPAFTENLQGMQIGETRTFRVAYPASDDYSALAGKEVEYEATLEAVRQMESLALDDDLPRTLGEPCDTLAEFRQVLAERLQERYEQEANERLGLAALQQLLRTHVIEVPPTLLQRQWELRMKKLIGSALMEGIDPRSDEIDWKAIGEHEREQALEDVRSMLLLRRIAEQEGLTVSDEEVDAEIKRIAAQRGQSAIQLKERLTKQGAISSMKLELKNRKALDLVLQAATIEREVVDGER